MSNILVLNESNYYEIIGSGVVVVDFYADWCGPCKMMGPIFEEASGAYEGRAVFAKINVDENSAIAAGNQVISIPTLIFFKDGKAADRVTGVIQKPALCKKVDDLL